ncbi:universal stress protein [Planosporangium thailandense]|uniref:Universal stress protein n=1 Tax=Planosporangium thailandense TaxID=765197 RepID=A0ABX0Y2H5_9ACTN|nr:universal stress protein [Planosporangium thailandense]NJC72337.1 universal stress protein [Planosporangium thailandense]
MADINNNQRIVVGVDGSEPSRRALRWALQQAQATGASVEAIHVWDLPLYAGVAPVIDTVSESEALAKGAEQILSETVAEVAGEHPAVPVRTRVLQGHPAVALLRASEGAGLLVVGSRGHGGFVGALLGSVSQYCVHHATCPVLVIRGEHH